MGMPELMDSYFERKTLYSNVSQVLENIIEKQNIYVSCCEKESIISHALEEIQEYRI